ncbi:MAG TPA: glycosyltransferase family 4 protein [Rugosimonospora sp.]|nr:glycosyltransferase family 4 protein [Rugosimonospora sp.]
MLRILSLYEGFFAGGARVLHSGVLAALQARGGQSHSVLSMHRDMRRESLVQRMDSDASYQVLRAAGVTVAALRRGIGGTGRVAPLTAAAVATAVRYASRADVILSLKEQPLYLVNQHGFPRRPVIVCLHRSDPEHHPAALADLRVAVAEGRVVAGICCAESTRAAYQAAGVPGDLLHVIPNGVDLARFRPVPPRERTALRRSLGVPPKAKVVVFAARYDLMKNVPLFLRAARAFLDADRAGHVLLCGAGMSRLNAQLCTDLEEYFADAPKLLRRVHLLGLRRDMETVYAAADVVSLTSSFGEAAPLCLIEGAMCGAVPVSTDVGDCAGIVAGHGILTPSDGTAIAAAWTEAVERRAEYGPALESCRERFSHTRMVDAYAALIARTHEGLGLAAGVPG